MSDLNNIPNLPNLDNLDIDLNDLEDLGLSDDILDDSEFDDIVFDNDTTEKKEEVKKEEHNLQNQNKKNNSNLEELLDKEFSTKENEQESHTSTKDSQLDEIDFEDLTSPSKKFDNMILNNSPEKKDALDDEIDNLFIDNNESKDITPKQADNIDDIDFDLEDLTNENEKNPVKTVIEEEKNSENTATNNIEEANISFDNFPTWIKEMRTKKDAQISHAFLLDFNTKDYVNNRDNLKDVLLTKGILGTFDIIVSYDLANGIQFIAADEAVAKERFFDMTGLNDKKAALEDDELYAALNDTPLEEADNTPPLPESPLDIFVLLAPLFKQPSEYGNDGRILLYVDAIEMIMPEAPVAQMQLNERKLKMIIEEISSTPTADYNNNCIIMVSNNGQDVHTDLKRSSSRIEKISIPLPDKTERLDFINNSLIKDLGLDYLFTDTLTPQGFSNLSAGLSRMQMEDIAFRAINAKMPITEQLVRDRKTDIIKSEYEDVIEIIDSPITFDHIGGMNIIKKYFKEEVINPIKNGEDDLWMVPLGVMFLGPAGTGKQAPVSEPVLTTEGWMPIGDLMIGDEIIGGSGNPCKVVGVYPQKNRNVYRIHFSDGTETRVGPDHLWLLENKNWDTPRILTTKEMLNNGLKDKKEEYKYAITLPIINFSPRKTSINPYIVGTVIASSYVKKEKEETSCKIPQKHFEIIINDLLVEEKFIPKEYILNSITERTAVLQGIIDGSNATLDKTDNSIIYSHYSKSLIEGIDELVRSMGGYTTINKKDNKYTIRMYVHPSIEPFNRNETLKNTVKKLKLKTWAHSNSDYAKMNLIHTPYSELDKNTKYCQTNGTINKSSGTLVKYITDIEQVEDEDSVCIMVDDPTHCYITKGYTLTHNTLVAQAVASESQMNCVNLNISKILNKYVGASEKNFEKALQCISSMEPTIVIVEEIDNVFAGRGSDSSGVGGRLFKRFLEFMSDTSRRGKVIVIATSNYPSRMDAALKRPGRFDKKIPFLVPEKKERLEIINVLTARKGFSFEVKTIEDIKNINQEKQKELINILQNTEGMTGAELETIVQKAITYAYKEKRNTITTSDMYLASEVVIPSTSAIAIMTQEALIECNDLEFIPEKYKEATRKLKEQLTENAPKFTPGSTNG